MKRETELDLSLPTNVQQLKEVAIYLEGLAQGQGNLIPLGMAHLDNLWRIIHIMNLTTRLDQPEASERLHPFDVIRTPVTAGTKPGAWVKFDLNKYVRFKPGPRAEEAINAYFEGKPGIFGKTDAEGWVTMQLHVVFAVFGPFIESGSILANEFYLDYNQLGK